jgi:hypothetical protein
MATIGWLVALPAPAHACSCAEFVLDDAASEIGLAFVGTQTDYEVDDEFADDGAVLTFDVERVYVGEATETTVVNTPAQSSACGVNFGNGNRVAVVSWGDTGVVGLCTSSVVEADLERVYGEGRAPTADAAEPLDAGVSNTRYAVIGGVLVFASLGVVFGLRRVPSRRRPADTD